MENHKTQAINRLRRAIGHLKGVEKMIVEDKYCIDVLRQSLAVQNALKAVDRLIMDRHLHTCVSDAVRNEGEEKEKAIEEILAVFEEKRR